MSKYKKLTIKNAINLAAPHTRIASFTPLIFAFLFAKYLGYTYSLIQYITLTISCVLMQSSANTLNDYKDFVNGVDSAKDNVDKNDSVLVYNNINPKSVLYLAILFLSLGLITGLLSLREYKIIPIIIGIFGGIIVICYSMGPFKISYLPIGELVSSTVMGALIPLAILAIADGKIHLKIVYYALPIIFGIAMIMMTNNACDINKDKLSNRKTLAVILGKKKINKLYRLLLIIWTISVVILSYKINSLMGIILLAIGLIANKNLLYFLLKTDLDQKERIKHMKSILKYNLILNGIYLINIFLKVMRI